MTLALAIVPLFAAVGGAIDYSRYVSAKTDLQATMDAAVLAGTQAFAENGGNATVAIDVAQKFYSAQMAADGYQLVDNNLTFVVNKNKNGIAASGDVSIQTSFLAALGINSLPLLSSSQEEASVAAAGVSGSGSNLEISVMLDVTGSMCDDKSGPCTSGAKITALKTAAAALVDKVVWSDQSINTSKVALVPFNTMVRVEPDGQGGNVMKKITDLGPTWSGYYQTCTTGTGSSTATSSEANPTGNWTCTQTANLYASGLKIRPCVTDRYYDANGTWDVTDDGPGSNKWLNAASGNRAPLSGDGSDTPMAQGAGKTVSDPIWGWNYEQAGACYDTSNANQVVPLTNSPVTLKTAISGLEAYSGTAGVLGTAFAWYMISPNWKNVWTGQSQPAPYADLTTMGPNGKPKLRKISILMTDGGYNAYRSWKGQDMATVSTAAKAMCAAMKAKGIEVFTVGFDFNSLTSTEAGFARDTLQNCATDPSHFYDSPTGAQLVSAFDNIGQQIAATTTHLTK
jgi:Flp pilus assembly protein TadG